MQTKFTLAFLFLFSVFFSQAQSEEYVQNLTDTYFQSDEKIPIVFNKSEAILRDDCSNLLDSIITRTWENEAWKTDTRRVFQYDEEERDLLQTFEITYFDTGELNFLDKSEFSYSPNQSVVTVSYFNLDTEAFELGLRSTNTLEDDLIVSSIQENYEDGEWILYRRFTYTYNETGTRTETYTESWNDASQDYFPLRKSLFYYTVVDEFSYADSLLTQTYNTVTSEWEYAGIRIDYLRDTENRILQAEIGDYYANPGELTIFLRDEFFYDDVGNSFDVLNYYDFANEQPEELPLWRKYRNHYEGDLRVADSIYVYDAETMLFPLSTTSDLEYDIETRLFLDTEQINANNNPEQLVNSRQTEYYYPLCISDVEEEYTERADCKFANPISSGQSGACNLEIGDNATLNLYDVLGRKVWRQFITNGNSFSFRQLPANGVYFMTIENEIGIMLQRKIVVARE